LFDGYYYFVGPFAYDNINRFDQFLYGWNEWLESDYYMDEIYPELIWGYLFWSAVGLIIAYVLCWPITIPATILLWLSW
jgi:hypothetical protein